MTRMTAKQIEWVLVFDGAKALIFENEGFHDAPDLKILKKREGDNRPDREIKTDAPGRMPDTGKGQVSAMEEADFHDQAEARFVADLADELSKAAMNDKFDRLYVFGAKHALGRFRDSAHETLTDRIALEMAGDYVNHPVLELEKRLKKALEPALPD